MRITNRYGLPGAIVEAVKNDDYDPGQSDITVTRLIGPPQIRILEKQNADALEEDASERMFSLMGKAMHTLLERSEPSALVEERLYTEVAGWKLSGQYDRTSLRGTTLQDYKLASVWEAMNGLKQERVNQLNVLRFLALENGYDVRKLEIVHLGRDWSKMKAKRGDHPALPIQRIPVTVWSYDDARAYVEERIRIHQQAEQGDVLECSDEDRWVKGEKWAWMREGRKSAVKLFERKEDAEHAIQTGGKTKDYLEHRPGEAVRCNNYCAVAEYCPQFQREQQKEAA